MEATFARLVQDVRSAEELEAMLAGSNMARSRSAVANGKARQRTLARTSEGNPLTASVGVDPVEAATESVKRVVESVHEARKRQRVDAPTPSGDDVLCRMAPFTDMFALQQYERFLHYVPRIVNVVRLHVTGRLPRSVPGPAMDSNGHGSRTL